ncbi:hypothetical protein GGQ87_001552 [Brevundimonas alba]|uniref:Phytanoyl-CoA dioxygenase n=2 Tax=Brevundimonas alba TaxID=74314 RepID=A0A7X5YKE6_9CAUL|nr:hypothetical protein [Brevundimonas alba]
MSPGYAIVEPGPDVRPMDEIQWSPDLVRYEAHDAYRDFLARPALGARIKASVIFTAALAKLLLKRVIRYEMIPYDVRDDRSPRGRLRFVGAALSNATAGAMRKRHATAAPASAAGAMDSLGCMVVTMPPAKTATLEEAAAPLFEELAARRGQSNGKREFEESRAQASRARARTLFDAIETALQESGVMAASGAYLGRPARLIDVNPQINDVSDSFWRDIFPDVAADQLPATAYCHRDASGGDLKAIIYLSDVGERNGPFSYVLGSNRMRISRVDDLICETNDSNGLGATDPVARERFAALPKKLRQKGAFGNDLTPASPLSERINAGLWAIKAPKGSIVLFDTKGIHRGGMVVEGERRVITCVIG